MQHSQNTSTNKTSVIITTHNYGRFLSWCIQSVLAQTIRPCRIVVVDDASEDDTKEIASNFLNEIEYYRVSFRNAQKARNYGLAKASSEYVLFLDADDFIANTMIERMELALDQNHDARVAYCDKFVFGDANAIKSFRLPYYWESADFSIKKLQSKNFITISSLIRRKCLSGFDERINRLQDWDTWLTILKFDSHAIRVPEPLLHYRAHGSNLSLHRKELFERLKILTKHGLLTLERPSENGRIGKPVSRQHEVLVLTITGHVPEYSLLHELTEAIGCHLRVIVGLPTSQEIGQHKDKIVRQRNVILQTTECQSLDDLFWRFAGVASCPDVMTTFVTPELRTISRDWLFWQGTGPVIRSELNVEGMLNASSLEDMGAFALSPAAIRSLLYLPPAVPQTIISRIRHRFARLLSEHFTWRFGR
jgi:hypothetical protein